LKVGNDYNFIRYVEKRVITDKISPAAVAGEIKRGKLFKTIVSKTTMYRYIAQGLLEYITILTMCTQTLQLSESAQKQVAIFFKLL
jgi:hypothetical protein